MELEYKRHYIILKEIRLDCISITDNDILVGLWDLIHMDKSGYICNARS